MSQRSLLFSVGFATMAMAVALTIIATAKRPSHIAVTTISLDNSESTGVNHQNRYLHKPNLRREKQCDLWY